eukprot:2863349-Pleurochrysis_carterae.AAC.1
MLQHTSAGAYCLLRYHLRHRTRPLQRPQSSARSSTARSRVIIYVCERSSVSRLQLAREHGRRSLGICARGLDVVQPRGAA